ncbi:MAG: helix-turn-helix domain-containing protein [Acidithiobacillus sp.]
MEPSTMSLSDCVTMVLDRYFNDLCGEEPSNLHNLIIAEVERALLAHTLQHCEGQRGVAAQWLGINRNTLRKKLQHYGLDI